jgi:hypothetical protein
MRRRGWIHTLLVVVVGCLAGAPVLAADRGVRSDVDVHDLYAQLTPGMSLREVATLAGGRLGATAEPVTSWLLWSPLTGGDGTAVLRASFQDGRLVRLEYESFGAEYRRLVKGTDPWIEIAGDELTRIWRQSWRATQAADSCRQALDAYHHVVLDAQERLTADEQQAWARALLLRRTAEQHHLSSAGR